MPAPVFWIGHEVASPHSPKLFDSIQDSDRRCLVSRAFRGIGTINLKRESFRIHAVFCPHAKTVGERGSGKHWVGDLRTSPRTRDPVGSFVPQTKNFGALYSLRAASSCSYSFRKRVELRIG